MSEEIRKVRSVGPLTRAIRENARRTTSLRPGAAPGALVSVTTMGTIIQPTARSAEGRRITSSVPRWG